MARIASLGVAVRNDMYRAGVMFGRAGKYSAGIAMQRWLRLAGQAGVFALKAVRISHGAEAGGFAHRAK